MRNISNQYAQPVQRRLPIWNREVWSCLWDKEEASFRLCGWYRDYMSPSVYPPIAYVSEAQLRVWDMSLEEPDNLLILQKNWVDGYQVEAMLYEDIRMTDSRQQFYGGNTYRYSIMNEFVGGYSMAVFGAALVLLCVYLLIHNVLSISIQKEIRQIGLLDTLGTTRKQIRNIYLYQNAVILFRGCVIGTAAAACTVLIAVPRALGNLYLYNFGRAADLKVFRPSLLAASIVFTVCIVIAAVRGVIRKATALSPLEAMHYVGVSDTGNRGQRTGKKGVYWNILLMAGKNLLRFRKRCLITVFSLFWGITTALAAVVLTTGTDYTNSIEKRPDFSIGGNSVSMTNGEDYNDEFAPVSEETKQKILSELSNAQSYIQTNRIILGALSFVLILMGLLNYLNVMTTEMFSRRRELSIMESVGMTGRQIRQMLIAEGGIYFLLAAVLILTAGSGVLQLLHKYMDSRIAYFKFIWPGTEIAVCLCILFLLCILVPFVLYYRMEKESLPQRIA